MKPACSVAGCSRPVHSLGLCGSHRKRLAAGADLAAPFRAQHRHAAGGVVSPTYRVWQNMLTRCTNPKALRFERYGGRGITVCERWRDFRSFLADMGERPEGMSLDRVDNDRGYEPGNCRWATAKEQAANRDAAIGERAGRARLTAADVAEIRAAPRYYGCRRDLADHFGVSPTTIRAILDGKSWRHLLPAQAVQALQAVTTP